MNERDATSRLMLGTTTTRRTTVEALVGSLGLTLWGAIEAKAKRR